MKGIRRFSPTMKCCLLAFTIVVIKVYWFHHIDNFNPPNRMTKKEKERKFVYLIQSDGCLSSHFKGERQIGNGTKCDCDVIVLNYKQKCLENGLKHVDYVYKTGTTWNSGRNFLYQYAMNRSTNYIYYILLDDDIRLRLDDDSKNINSAIGPWRAFERFLLAYKPAIAGTSYCYGITARCTTIKVPSVHTVKEKLVIDAAFNAFHYKALPYVLPYLTKGEDVSWHYSQYYMIMIARRYFKGFALVFTNVTAVNYQHREYPRKDLSAQETEIFESEVDVLVKGRNKNIPSWNGTRVIVEAVVTCRC